MVGNGVRPQIVSAQPKQTARQVWTGRDVDYTGQVSVDGRYLSFTDRSTGDLAIRDLSLGTNRRVTDTGGWDKSGDFAKFSVISPDSAQIAYSWWDNKASQWELRVLPLKSGQPKEPRVLRSSQSASEDDVPIGWTPDGRQLLVQRSPQGQLTQVGMLSLQDGSYRALKSAWAINRPRLSPDGRWVAYGGIPDEKTQVYDVYVLATDGSQETDVIPGPANDVPTEWSPDGSRLYFGTNRTGTISQWSIGIASGKSTGAPEMVRPDTAMFPMGMTRNGVWYYFVRGTSRSNIYTAELGPSGTVNKGPALVNERMVNSTLGASISPDGKSLAYYSIRNGPEHVVIVRTLETGKERDFRQEVRLSDAGSGPMWFPDSRSLLITTYDLQKQGTRFFRLDLASGEREAVFHASKGALSFKLSPDGKMLFYTESEQTAGSQFATRLVRYDLDTRRETELSGNRVISEIAVSPDGKQVAYLAQERASAPRYLAVMPAAGGPAKEIFRGADLAARDALEWTPDQKFLLFAKSRGGDIESLWRVPATGGSPESTGLSRSGGIKGPRMHPDGKRLFFYSFEPNANEIWALENFLTVKGGK
jgi:TolB protein